MSSPDSRPLSQPPTSKRTLSTERSFFRDLVEDLTLRVEWLEQVIESVPDSGALSQLRGWAKALRELHTSMAHLQAHLGDPRFERTADTRNPARRRGYPRLTQPELCFPETQNPFQTERERLHGISSASAPI